MISRRLASVTKLGGSADDDGRPYVKDLLNEHSSGIAAVRQAIEKDPLYDSAIYDDVWILRFLLSHKGSKKKAIDACLGTMKFRKEYKLNELGDVRHRFYDHRHPDGDGGPDAFPILKQYLRLCKDKGAVMHQLPDPDRGIVTYYFMGKVDMARLGKMPEEEFSSAYVHTHEMVHQVLDEVTRRTGRLTKELRIVDASGFGVTDMDRGYMRVESAAAKRFQDFYPQVLGSMVVVNAPGWIHGLWNALRPLFPRRLVRKLDFASTGTRRKDDAGRFRAYVSEDDLPEYLGGESKEWPPASAGEYFKGMKSTTND